MRKLSFVGACVLVLVAFATPIACLVRHSKMEQYAHFKAEMDQIRNLRNRKHASLPAERRIVTTLAELPAALSRAFAG